MKNNLTARASVTINAPVPEVWDALVNPETIERYMFGARVATDWREGSPITWKGEWQGKAYEDRGVVLRIKPDRLLSYSHFSPLSGLPDKAENYHTVTLELSAKDGQTVISLSQDNNETEEARSHSEKNWQGMLAGLKKLLERPAGRTIVPHLWFDREAVEAAGFYASIFPGSAVGNVTTLRDTPSGDCDVVSFHLWGRKFMAISAGPLFKFNPSVSFIVNFDPLSFGPPPSREKKAGEKMEEVWKALARGGKALMPIGKYPFSERYGWIQDKYGLSWQLILTDPKGDPRPPIIPSLLFAGRSCGLAEAAVNFYLSVFRDSKPGSVIRYRAGQEPDKAGTVAFADFRIENDWFAAMDSAREPHFTFNEAVSFMVYCSDQEEIDYYWDKLSAAPEAEQCGWLKDKFGVSWQITPSAMDEMMRSGTEEQAARLTKAFLKMKKFDLAALQKAYRGD